MILAVPACASSTAGNKPSSGTVGSPMSNYCASKEPCPGISRKKFEVCGSCDPSTRYFRQAMCSLDEKIRKAVDSCVQGRASISITGKIIFGGNVAGCVRQRLENEPQMLEAFTSIAKKHEATEGEQMAWRKQCDHLWAQHTAKNGGGGAPPPAKKATTP
ncbi:MAG: hypothetical protein KC503_16280 [Myxococcales bacterium]|nr:hypothetical protein [Myxococcales bacterium]